MADLAERYLGTESLDPEYYAADLALLDRYQAVSGEVVRIALVGVAVLGFFLDKLTLKAPSIATFEGALIRYSLGGGVFLLAVAAAAGLAHRYYSSDGVYYHLRAIRRFVREGKRSDKDVQEDGQRSGSKYKTSHAWMRVAVALLALGGMLVALAFLVLVATIKDLPPAQA